MKSLRSKTKPSPKSPKNQNVTRNDVSLEHQALKSRQSRPEVRWTSMGLCFYGRVILALEGVLYAREKRFRLIGIA
jgi:hypothetical protein